MIYQDDVDGESFHVYDIARKEDKKILDGHVHSPEYRWQLDILFSKGPRNRFQPDCRCGVPKSPVSFQAKYST